MISSITMKNCATYSQSGVKIEGCSEVNFLYGPNGSGKSTISNFLMNSSDSIYSECSYSIIDNQSVPDILVYNRRFRERNFRGNWDGIFTLGEATIEEIEKIEEIKQNLEKRTKERDRAESNLSDFSKKDEQLEVEFLENVWKYIFKKYENVFSEAFTGLKNNKRVFRNEVLRRQDIRKSSTISKNEAIKKAGTLFGALPDACPEFDLRITDIVIALNKIENNPIWQKVVIGNSDVPIAKLINSLKNSDWVNKGREYIQFGTICPFCQQNTITPELKEQIEKFFGEEYKTDKTELSSLVLNYNRLVGDLQECFNVIRDSANQIKIGEINIDVLFSKIELILTQCNANIEEMSKKENELSRKITLSHTSVADIEAILIDGNRMISQHNTTLAHYKDEKAELINEIWNIILVLC